MIEQRGEDSDFTMDMAITENERFFAAFGKREGDLILIDRDYKTDLERAEAE